MREAVILAGGAASRLGDIAGATPKPLLEVGGKPFLDYVLFNLARHGYRRVILSVGRLAERYADYEPDVPLEIELVHSVETEPLGTAGALGLASGHLRGDEVLVVNGDTIFDANLLDLGRVRRAAGASVAIALRHVEDTGRYGAVRVAGDGSVTAFAEKSTAGPGLISGGIYACATDVLRALPARPHSFETDVLPGLVASGRVAGAEYPGFFVDIGLPESLAAAHADVAAWRDKPAVIFDRDGVLNVDHGHVATPERFEWMPGAREAVKLVNDAGALAFVVTNQAGIAKGLYTEPDYLAFESWIAEELASAGAHLDATYHCPHHPDGIVAEYRAACDCRKPAPGMLNALLRDWGVRPTRTAFIGDKSWDMDAAAAAGVLGVPFEGEGLLELTAATLVQLECAS